MLNKVTLIGRLGQTPEVKNTNSGFSVCRFSLATTEKWKDKGSGQNKESTEWHRIVAFGKVGELAARFLDKGLQTYVEGKLVTKKYQDRQGIEKQSTEIHANKIVFIEFKKEDAMGNNGNSVNHNQNYNFNSGYSSEDIPF